MKFIEEKLNRKDSIEILKVYFNSSDENFKKGFKEITPFKDKKYIFVNKGDKINLTKWYIFLLKIRDFLHLNIRNNFFTYKGFFFILDEPLKNEIDIKGFENKKLKLYARLINNGKSLKIERIISLEKGMGRKTIKGLCDYYNLYNITVEPSVYGIRFWQKMKDEYKGKINIVINT